jgi:hypothetical protein
MLFSAAVATRYHRRRATFLERASASMSVLILLGGATALVGLVGDKSLFARILGLAIVLVGVVQVVFQVDRCAAEHRRWLREWSAILSEIRQNENPPPAMISAWVKRQHEIESDCVGEMRALTNDCYNRAMYALEREGEPFKITWWQRLFMQLISFDNAAYR